MPTIQTATDYIADLLTARASHRPRSIEQFRLDIQTAVDALKAGVIANATLKELMFSISNRLDEARDHVNMSRPKGTEWMDLVYMHQMAGRLKKSKDETERQFLTEVMPIAELMLALKPLAVKRQTKPVEDIQAKYLAPRAGIDAAAMVQKALLEVTDAAYQQMLDDRLALYHKMVTHYKAFAAEFSNAREYEIQREYHKNGRHMAALLILREASGLEGDRLDEKLRAMAKREVDFVRDQFLIKNLKKLDSIVEAKGDFAAIAVIGYHFNMACLEGNFKISFQDGSSFCVTNSVETAYSYRGKRFNRFPLRFHDVVMADGRRMSRPSEQRVNELFCAKP